MSNASKFPCCASMLITLLSLCFINRMLFFWFLSSSKFSSFSNWVRPVRRFAMAWQRAPLTLIYSCPTREPCLMIALLVSFSQRVSFDMYLSPCFCFCFRISSPMLSSGMTNCFLFLFDRPLLIWTYVFRRFWAHCRWNHNICRSGTRVARSKCSRALKPLYL